MTVAERHIRACGKAPASRSLFRLLHDNRTGGSASGRYSYWFDDRRTARTADDAARLLDAEELGISVSGHYPVAAPGCNRNPCGTFTSFGAK